MMELSGVFSGHATAPIKPGQDIAKAFKNYLMMGQNAGGFPTTNVVDAAAGVSIGGVFASQLPAGLMVGTQIASHLTTMAITYMSGQQIGPPITAPTHTPQLMELFEKMPTFGMKFAKDLADVLDSWTKTWVVSGLIPGSPPIPFSGPLS